MLFNQVAGVIGDPPRPVADPDFSKVTLPVRENHDQLYGIPSLEALGKLFYVTIFTMSNFYWQYFDISLINRGYLFFSVKDRNLFH